MQVLDLSPSEIGIDDDFFGLGGNSISSIRLVSAIRKELDVSLSVSQVFSSRTVRLLSGEISSGRLEGTSITSVSVGQAHEQLLSYAQQRLWFIDQYQPGSWAYNIPMVVRLREGVDLDLLLQCLYQVVDRHHVLRSLILTSNEGTGYQQVADVAVEARSCHFSCASELEAAISRECQHVFDLSSELPLRICVYHLNEARYLSIVVHAPYSLRRLVDGCAGR
jgi:acyl carrier protein